MMQGMEADIRWEVETTGRSPSSKALESERYVTGDPMNSAQDSVEHGHIRKRNCPKTSLWTSLYAGTRLPISILRKHCVEVVLHKTTTTILSTTALHFYYSTSSLLQTKPSIPVSSQ
jgi:hypothetical protein